MVRWAVSRHCRSLRPRVFDRMFYWLETCMKSTGHCVNKDVMSLNLRLDIHGSDIPSNNLGSVYHPKVQTDKRYIKIVRLR
jgi:hypothetical protein